MAKAEIGNVLWSYYWFFCFRSGVPCLWLFLAPGEFKRNIIDKKVLCLSFGHLGKFRPSCRLPTPSPMPKARSATAQNYYIFVTVTSMRRGMFGAMISSTTEKAMTVVAGMKTGKRNG
jgi:hypothetical protein